MIDKEFRIELKIRNNIFLYWLEKAGYKTIGEFCRLHSITTNIGQYINLTKSPLMTNGDFFPVLYKAAKILGCMPDDLFSESQLHMQIKSNKRSIQVSEAEMNFMLENGLKEQKLLEDIVDEEKNINILEEVLETLTPREQKVLSMRFGLREYSNTYSFGEIAEECKVTRERIRQIESKALRKLRNPHRVEKLRGLYSIGESN